jgi:3-phytase
MISAGAVAAAFAALASDVKTVSAIRETDPVGVAGDAADDPAIVIGAQPEDTRIIGTQKKGGLFVYDLSGKAVQEIPGGRPNNVDTRDGFPWAEGAGTLVATSDRTDNTVVLYRFDDAARRLDPAPKVRIATGFAEVYGVALGRHRGAFIAVATSKTGQVLQWTLSVENGAIKAERTRAFALSSIAEGCVIDDETETLYISEELVGLWRFPLDPSKGDTGERVDTVKPQGQLAADVEGVAIWRGPGTQGYLVASAQGESRFNVYDRAAPNRFRGTFRITANASGSVDAVSTTDGLEIVSTPLGADYPKGLLVVQDDINTNPSATQNFKFVSWADVEAALGLAAPPAR